MTTLDVTVAGLMNERAALDAKRAQHTDELTRLDRQMGAATLDSDPIELAGVRERRRLLIEVITGLDQRVVEMDARIEPMEAQQSRQKGRVGSAKRLIAALQSPQGLEHPDIRNMPAQLLPREVARARKVLAADGETLKVITIKL